ncbi:probable receptor-like protein kinase At5g18500 [Salvia miltiorrhiza]|uniref:probable receptor-like protein kinase At5g18500 n=1 Tax=Salvia miltiorrhiza TaxID=226208 RepID=UPI0025AD3AA8|nr:probable receptor-like protein kinase At5g18500 [Salvia miltiorrhiza]
MESFVERSCSSRRCTPLMLGGVVVAFDAFKTHDFHEFEKIISDVLKREETFQEVRTITFLGGLDRVLHPMGFKIHVGHKSFMGAHGRAIEEDVSRKVDGYVSTLQRSAVECEEKGVEIQVKIVVGAPLMDLLVEEISSLRATWAVLDRQLKRETRSCFLKQISCKVAQVRDNLCLEILRPYYVDNCTTTAKNKLVYSLGKPVPLPPAQDDESDRNSLISLPVTPMIRSTNPKNCPLSPPTTISEEEELVYTSPQQEVAQVGSEHDEVENKLDGCSNEGDAVGSSYSEMKIEAGEYSSDTSPEDTDSKEENKARDEADDEIQENKLFPYDDKANIMCPDSLGCSYTLVQAATENFSFDNFIGEGGYGIVYRGKLGDGQLVAVKVQKETKAQTSAEFQAEVSPLSSARHTNIVALLGYCSKGNLRILIYEYINNKSLEWHLFDNAARVLEWSQRYSIAIGAAKGLRFLHEECRGSPIIHCNIRPSNVMLTQDLVPMLGDFGLARYSTSKFDKQRNFLGNLGYVAPECTEGGLRCVKADVYAFGILVMQLISGRKAVDQQQHSIMKWALCLIESLALEDLVDPRLGDAYCVYEVYNMSRAAYACVQSAPLSRPTMREVLSILEGTNDHLRHVKRNLYPMIIRPEPSLD